MNLQEQIRDYLKPAGKQVISLVEEDIEFLSSHIESDEKIISATTSWKRATFFLYLLTSKKILTSEKIKKEKNLISYDLNAISNLIVNRKFLSVEVMFTHLKNEIKIKLNSDDATKAFADELENNFGISEKPIPKKKEKVPKAIKLNMTILNGKEQIKESGFNYVLQQTKHGYIDIVVDFKEPETFKLIKWERVENVQKSASSIVGWTVIGSKFGNAGAIAGAMGANIGKDKSVATLFLKRENGEKVPLVIKCDKKDLEKLSLLIVAEEEEIIQADVTPSPATSIPTEELIKLKELLDVGILTQEEFDAKKKQLLGI
ncbi:SHOCT domain-containing protein [Lysinibacillus fusiformis]|uniref:SHOCT domain-containing protein n=1 Tax=Lysinibacillus fusiformis TaxID=28031 RepID=UPI00088664A9|nr:SHOCT domain-containing protein [Lysinibacillus fusiformis]SCX51861.1 Short C-terminal domain-containing protein [Lysinibacillus fusiformis]SDB27968.1 Short C-terminal domain-containing protein [Lysinibacillus fusiformis]SFI22739.1 Short C-terminal domain-containing protein [Lysinibacillus fusiformis]SFS82868.1 Short C-terminal domain-containing protein [Lysinibacillus fusiformis]